MSVPVDTLPIEARLAAAGLPPLPRTAWLEIDLERLRHNYRVLRAAVPAGVRVDAVVKANAYGHGAIPVGRALEAAGADGFAVAAFDEAVELREAGIRAPILCLYAVTPEVVADAMRLEVAVSTSDETLLNRMLAAAAVAAGRPATTAGTLAEPAIGPLLVHVEVETGLGRAGLALERVVAAVDRIAANPGARLAGIWTHLAAGSEAAPSRAQDARFATVAGLGADLRRHVAASAGLLARTVPPYDGVRIGLAVYGLAPDDLADGGASPASDLLPVMSLHARPVRVADLLAGWGVSYGPSFITNRPSRIATLPIGYGDGLARVDSNRVDVLVRGRRARLVGNVTMDAVMVDVTDVPGPAVTIDDEFVLLGRQGEEEITAAELARLRTTNSWEVVTAMAHRLPRVYHSGALPEAIQLLGTRSGR